MAQDIAAYRAAGVDRVVSMLTKVEASELGLADEARLCVAAALEFEHHPIVDFGLPEVDAFDNLLRRIAHWLDAGQGVAVHCRAGIGRSGMVTAGVLIALGDTADQAMKKVSTARGVSIPDTVEQGSFINAFGREFSQ